MSPDAYLEMARTESQHWWFRARRDIVAAVLADLPLPADADILEIGCGTGGNLDMLARFGRVRGLEMDAVARRLARDKTGGRYPVVDGRCPDAMPFAAASFDLICLLDCLEHIADDAAALAGVARLLRPGGLVVITVPAHPWLWSRHDEYLHHCRRYRRRQLRLLVGQAGLRLRRLGYFNALLFPLAVAARVKDRCLPGARPTGSAVPPALLNAALYRVFRQEARWLPLRTLPLGVSLLAVAGVGDLAAP